MIITDVTTDATIHMTVTDVTTNIVITDVTGCNNNRCYWMLQRI